VAKLSIQKNKIHADSETVNQCIEYLVKNKEFAKFILSLKHDEDSDA